MSIGGNDVAVLGYLSNERQVYRGSIVAVDKGSSQESEADRKSKSPEGRCSVHGTLREKGTVCSNVLDRIVGPVGCWEKW
jgi:hypothetical protein